MVRSAMDSLKFTPRPAMPYPSTPCKQPNTEMAVRWTARRAGGLQPSSTPLDTQRLRPLSFTSGFSREVVRWRRYELFRVSYSIVWNVKIGMVTMGLAQGPKAILHSTYQHGKFPTSWRFLVKTQVYRRSKRICFPRQQQKQQKQGRWGHMTSEGSSTRSLSVATQLE
jgi:hypothetical protein